MMPLKARQHQGPVQMSGCCDTSQKEAVSQWKPGGQRKNKRGDTSATGDPYTVMQRSKWGGKMDKKDTLHDSEDNYMIH